MHIGQHPRFLYRMRLSERSEAEKFFRRAIMARQAGIMLSEAAFSNFPLLCKNAGLNFFIVDWEHGGFDYSFVAKVVMTARLCGMSAIVRLADSGRKDITKFADMGAGGFLLPMTESAEEIARVVRYAKYRTVGERGISTMRAHTLYSPPDLKEYRKTANEAMELYAQLETRTGVEQAEAILSCQGVNGCFVGPNDLSDDCGCMGCRNAEPILRAIEKVGQAAKRTEKRAGIITANPCYLQKAKQCGYEMFAIGSELNAIADFCGQIAETVAENPQG